MDRATRQGDAETKFALVMLETAESRRHIQEDRTDHRARIQTWMAQQAQASTLIGGEAFEPETIGPVTVRHDRAGNVTVNEWPYGGDSETLGGYILVEVADRDEAVELARSWPTEETIEIRPIWSAS